MDGNGTGASVPYGMRRVATSLVDTALVILGFSAMLLSGLAGAVATHLYLGRAIGLRWRQQGGRIHHNRPARRSGSFVRGRGRPFGSVRGRKDQLRGVFV